MPSAANSETPSIDSVLDDFLADERERLSERTFRNYADVVGLLKDYLNSYAYEDLGEFDKKRWQRAYDGGDEGAFTNLFGPDQIVPNLSMFLGYFMVRKVVAGEELLRASGTVTRKLAKWLERREYIDSADARIGADAGAEAARDLPRAEKLTGLLHEVSLGGPRVASFEDLDEADLIEDYVDIARVEEGAIWFGPGWASASEMDETIGPIEVPREASDLAQVGWNLYAELARVDGRWYLIGVGSIYP
ncbi:MAG: hypothetical protein DCC49_02260 [Acidobacteria bacterium]|nr:MAG: hypothetical protein DCC49_02260 [Acidobacteriota bacterium]